MTLIRTRYCPLCMIDCAYMEINGKGGMVRFSLSCSEFERATAAGNEYELLAKSSSILIIFSITMLSSPTLLLVDQFFCDRRDWRYLV